MPGLLAAALPAMVQGLFGLAGGFLGGEQNEKERRESFEDWQKKRNVIGQTLKPQYSRYSPEKDYGTFDNLLKRLLVGSIGDAFKGQTNDWGINIEDILAGFGAAQNPTYQGGEPTTGIGGYGNLGPRNRMARVDEIMSKYDMV